MLHHQSWVPNLLRLRFGIRFFVFGTHPNALLSTPINKRVPAEILPLHGGGVTTFSLRLILAKSNESRIREYIRRTANFPGWSLLLPSGLFEALKVFIDTIRNDAAESKRLHFLRNDLFRAAYHETSKEASNAFSEMEFIIGCSKELLNKHRFFVLVDDPALASDLIPATVYERYPRLHGRVKCEPLAASSLVFVGTFSDLVSQFN
ncbi:hypothetical protein DI09_325p20 [Mitosporidium daphniae]|uniref:Uncharacterized protein n=1 Tax=Mitosporidium daphniae TaxID=1485682 RepID=A0A098VV05_9MICR|nr:uncharacterized protein DI09_325p20 [Mitosporidium daphniae]KGG51546.1 hypothetical protein DI09_325p20 [Mitosporidium daphniae]|eukprot:XP_013237982.1 uncharacterized protein DI09_325p20 [Mitosporidium daphniae]